MRTGALAKSIGVIDTRGVSVRVGARNITFAVHGTKLKRVDGGGINPSKYAHLVEFGTSRAPANPFFRRSIDGAAIRMLDEYNAVIARRISELASAGP